MKLEKVAWEKVPDQIKTFMVMTVPSMATLPLREEVANALIQLVADAYEAGYRFGKSGINLNNWNGDPS